MNLVKFLRYIIKPTLIWPDIDHELADIKEQGFFKGKVLNAGCGWRDISHLIDGKLVNQDLRYDDERRDNVDIYSPLDSIPVSDGYFDAVISIAVMEHVQDPCGVMAEMVRVLAPGGVLVMSIPFMQPEHKYPTDFQRYTKDGIVELCTSHGLRIIEINSLFTVYHTLFWIADIYLGLHRGIAIKILRKVVLRFIGALAVSSNLSSDVIASAFRVVAVK